MLAFAGAVAGAPPAWGASPALLALDCDAVAAQSVRDVLAREPAPRVILLQGSLPQVTMDPFAQFLIGMGYPRERIADPRDGSLSRSSAGDSEALAGEVAWYYEHDGMAPVLIGHSRGGMLVVRTLHELAGAFHPQVPVRDPVLGRTLERTTIVDPHTGGTRPVVGVSVDYAAAIATGKLPRLWQGQWDMLQRLRDIPDTVRDFAGFRIAGDLIAGDFLGDDPYVARGTARVRNVVLPASYSHIGAAQAAHLAADPLTRAWIDAWRPDASSAPPAAHDTRNLLHAAAIWHGVKRAWCRAAQARAREEKPS